jgi:DNA-binding CsgD family transcriptional regulator
MKTRLPLLPLFIDEIERLNHFIDVLNALDRHVARPQRAHVYAAWRSTIDDRDSSYVLGRNVFVHASVPKEFYPEFLGAYAHYGHTPMARYARLSPSPALLTWHEHRQRLKLNGDGLWFHELAQRYGMLDGLYCAHWQWTIGYWTPTIFTPTDDDRKILDIAAYFAAARMEQLMAARKKKLDGVVATLSPREQLTLIRYSLGDSEQEIADRLGVSTGRVNNLLNAARKKLKAKSRPHAVRIAVLVRMIP